MFGLLLERSKRTQALDALIKHMEYDISSRMFAAIERNKLSETRPSHQEWEVIYDACAADEAFIGRLETVRGVLPKPRFHARKSLTRRKLPRHYSGLLPYIANIIVMAEHHGQTEEAAAFRDVHLFVNGQIHQLLWERGAPFNKLFFSPMAEENRDDEAPTPAVADAGISIFSPRPGLKLAASSDDTELDIPEFLQPDFEPTPA